MRALIVTAAVAALLGLGAGTAVAGPQHGTADPARSCTGPDGGMIYGNVQPNGAVRIARGEGYNALVLAFDRPGRIVYKSCTGGGWVDAPANTSR